MKKAFVNGTVYTMKAENDTCSAFVVEDGKFIFCGSDEEAKEIAKDGEVVDLEGKPVLPGFIDTHQHVLSYARDLQKVNLKNAKSIEEVKKLISDKAATLKKGEWIQGAGFDQEKFDVKVMPTKADLDEAAPDNPVLITRYCLHVNVANSLALEIGGIKKGFVPAVENTVGFDENGEPTGVLWDQAAADLVLLIPDKLASFEARKDAVEMACRELNKTGIVGVHPIQGKHCDLLEDAGIYQELYKEGRLTARIYMGFDEYPGCGIRSGLGDHMVKYGFFKLFTDGSIGAHSALLNEPYTDDPTQIGVSNYTQEELDAKVQELYDNGMQTGVHVIGDRTVEMLLESLEKVYFANPKKDIRFRMIHMSILNESIIERLKKLPVVIDIQPMFVSTNVRWIESRLGPERAKYTYAYKSLLNAGLIVTAGSDSPIETYNPMMGAYAMVNRQGLDGYPEGGWQPQERVTPYEAMCMYTKNAAYVSYEEDVKGTIEEGKFADFVVLDADVFKIDPIKIKDIQVEKTYLNGNLVYSK